MRVRLAIPILLATACNDPSLEVIFDVDPQYRDSLSSSTLHIYQPLPAEPFDCEALAFGQVDAEVLRLSLVSEISLITTSKAPLEVDRRANKLFWADGVDGSGRRLVTGCAELGEVRGKAEVVIPSEPTKLVGVDQSPSLSVPMGGALTQPIIYSVTDLDERPLAGVEVRWQIEGAGGSRSSGIATTGGDGKAGILPQLPDQPGPFILDIAIRWADQDPAQVTGFIEPEAKIGILPGIVHDYRAGPVGPAGEPGFAALMGGEVLGYQVAYVYANATGEVQKRISQTIATSAPALGLIEPKNTGDRARAIVVGIDDDWTEFEIDGNPIMRAYDPVGLPAGLAPIAIESSGSCEPGSPQQVFISYEDAYVGIFTDRAVGDVLTTRIGMAPGFDVIASGCVTDETAGTTRLLVLANPDGNLYAATLIDDRFYGEGWLALSYGIGFSPPVGNSKERFLLGTQLSLSDVVISRFVVRGGTQTLSLVERGTDSPGSVPQYTSGGDVDGDGLLDIISLTARIDVEGSVRYALWAGLGRERQGKRISGEFELTGLVGYPKMMIVDFDHDGIDDVIVGEISGDLPPPETSFRVYSMGPVTRQ